MTIPVLFFGVVALVIGAAIGWVVGSARKGAEAQRHLAERDLARQERARSDAARSEMQRRVELAQQERAAADARAGETLRQLENHKQTEETFAALAHRAFKSVSESLVQTSKTQIDGSLNTKTAEIDALLKPVRDMLDNYRGELLKSEQTRNEVYGGLQEQIRSLLTAQESAQREASRLATALQSPTVQGSWGEMSLKRCIELAGMSEYCRDFETQQTFLTEEGRRLRPDVIVNLPNERVIAIDVKAPLTEYIAASSEPDETRKAALLAQHAKNLRRHVDALVKREYQASIGETLDFTVMFIPGEHFLAAALAADLALLDYAAERRIFLATPTVLLPLLRAVAASWRAEKTEENAKRMHDSAVELFARFVTVMEYITGVGDQLRKTVDSYNKVIRSIDTRLWPKGEELQRLAGSGKKLGDLEQLEAIPLESSKLRLTMQGEEPGVVVPIAKNE
ncbi:MAG TPA: DNA recombination protein RmuC [Thermoanaerobaculia bacterium]|jgi:DNA recombination protein RmuC|nr:DNA recombination protein RmuC [Thermoanaerobaculia bacterium]